MSLFDGNFGAILNAVGELQAVLNGHAEVADLEEDSLDTIYLSAKEIINNVEEILRETGA